MIYIFIFLFISSLPYASYLPFAITQKWHSQAYPLYPWRWTWDRICGLAMQFCWGLGTGRAEGSEYRLGGEAGELGWGDRRANYSALFTPHISIRAWILPELPLGDIAQAAPSLTGHSARLTTAQWVRSFVWDSAVVLFICKAGFQPSGFFLCVWFFKRVSIDLSKFDCESCNF